jgi:hypothetical protein
MNYKKIDRWELCTPYGANVWVEWDGGGSVKISQATGQVNVGMSKLPELIDLLIRFQAVIEAPEGYRRDNALMTLRGGIK